jgi:hypothetical protein
MYDVRQPLEPGKCVEVQVHYLISLGGWNDVLSICTELWTKPYQIHTLYLSRY